ncbi:hydrolase [Micromonospora sp. NBC_01699]|uniref:alpha/beta hydrolase family protein n=1 Tax=Micromonospora sp. NBC_01699 TaxID=2975984 RepID=UPI002E29B558|nr:hydrolase [Micromonospora sp. NBC_01699]
MKTLVAVFASAATLLAGSPAAAEPPAVLPSRTAAGADIRLTLPQPTGPERIGTVSLHLVDRSRPDPWVPDEKARELIVQIWYPARNVYGHPRAGWVSPGVAARINPPGSGFVLPVTHGHTSAPAAPGRRPVVMFSPGLGGERTGSTALVEDLASHGFVVVTIDHTHDAQFVEFPDGRIATHAIPPPADPDDEAALLGRVLDVRVADTRFVLDKLTAISRGRNPDASGRALPRGLAQALDLSRVGMFGSSLGGAGSAETMLVDRRVRAGLNLDGTFFGRVLTAGLDRPFLMMSADTEDPGNTDETWDQMWSRLRGPRYWIQLENAGHLSFTDFQVLLPQLGTPAEDSEPLIGSIDGERSIAVQRPYVRAFFDKHLRHRDGRLLAGPSARYPEMRFLP